MADSHSPKERLTHDELVRRAVAWLRRPASKPGWRKSGCGVVVPELVSYTSETPDAIGWTSDSSYLIECKCSRSDFMADQNKGHRTYGVGSRRFFLCEPGVIPPDRLPAGWGLLHCHPNRITVEVIPERNTERNLAAEISMMYSLLRRGQVRWLRPSKRQRLAPEPATCEPKERCGVAAENVESAKYAAWRVGDGATSPTAATCSRRPDYRNSTEITPSEDASDGLPSATIAALL